MQDNKTFMSTLKTLIYKIIEESNIINCEWHVGKVANIIDSKTLTVYVDGTTVAQKIPCNPDITFSANDEVWVHFVNGDSKNKFVPYKRAV